jgi:hypothetical protein
MSADAWERSPVQASCSSRPSSPASRSPGTTDRRLATAPRALLRRRSCACRWTACSSGRAPGPARAACTSRCGTTVPRPSACCPAGPPAGGGSRCAARRRSHQAPASYSACHPARRAPSSPRCARPAARCSSRPGRERPQTGRRRRPDGRAGERRAVRPGTTPEVPRLPARTTRRRSSGPSLTCSTPRRSTTSPASGIRRQSRPCPANAGTASATRAERHRTRAASYS